MEEKHNHSLLFLILGIVFILSGIGCTLFAIFRPHKETLNPVFSNLYATTDDSAKHYSTLTGLEISDESLNNSPVYCMQIPNGLDGARPQAGLSDAGVVFEAIAERGITRFAAIFQNPQNSILGPIRSLRLYHLQLDTPFDCTITHAGGADDALAAIRNGMYKDLTENYSYMYRGDYNIHLWNNLFTTPESLAKNSSDYGRTTSNVKGFKRQTPNEAEENRIKEIAKEKLSITEGTEADTSELSNQIGDIKIRFGSDNNFNIVYKYNSNSNSYDRYYATDTPHVTYRCEGNLSGQEPAKVCDEVQVSPKVVIAMIVNQKTASDNYHEDVTVIGNGKVHIFQNGTAIRGTWSKTSAAEQIKFYDESGTEIALIPGQTWIMVVPSYGSVEVLNI